MGGAGMGGAGMGGAGIGGAGMGGVGMSVSVSVSVCAVSRQGAAQEVQNAASSAASTGNAK
eukprot:3098170-Lingulodinium_polyedra.AAC.1